MTLVEGAKRVVVGTKAAWHGLHGPLLWPVQWWWVKDPVWWVAGGWYAVGVAEGGRPTHVWSWARGTTFY